MHNKLKSFNNHYLIIIIKSTNQQILIYGQKKKQILIKENYIYIYHKLMLGLCWPYMFFLLLKIVQHIQIKNKGVKNNMRSKVNLGRK